MRKKNKKSEYWENNEIKKNDGDLIDDVQDTDEEKLRQVDDEEEEESDQKQTHKKKSKKAKSKKEDRSVKIGRGIGKIIGGTLKTIGKVIWGMFKGLFGAGPLGIIVAIILVLFTIKGCVDIVKPLVYTKEEARTSDTIREQLVDIGELATLEYNYTKVVQRQVTEKYFYIISDTNNQLYSFDGVIKVGIDCKDLDIKVDKATKQYIVYVPEIKILSHEIDLDSYTYYFDEIEEGKELATQHEAEDMKEQEEKMTNQGLLDRARASADETIGRIIRAAINETNNKDYEIVFYHADVAEENDQYNLIESSLAANETVEETAEE